MCLNEIHLVQAINILVENENVCLRVQSDLVNAALAKALIRDYMNKYFQPRSYTVTSQRVNIWPPIFQKSKT